VSIGIAVLITVVSVMNGFEDELKKRILGVIPHIVLEKKGGFISSKDTIDKIKSDSRITSASTFFLKETILNSGNITSGAIIKGTDKKSELSIIPDFLSIGSLLDLDNGNNIILGEGLALELGKFPSEFVNIVVIDEENPLDEMPKIIPFKIVGIFSVGSEIDQKYALIGKESFKSTFDPKNGEKIEIKLNDVLQASQTRRDILMKLKSDQISAISWNSRYGGLFRAVQLEKVMISLLVSLILLVAIFSLLISINNLIRANEREIAILRTFGYSKTEIQLIFIQLIGTIGAIGIFFGNLVGILLSLNITEFFNLLSQIFGITVLDVYYLEYFPSIIKFEDVMMIDLIAIFLIISFGIIPANKAANTNPVSIIK
jgi:lipoprotein-releasing system permease protein